MEYEYLFTDRKRIGGNIEAIMKDRRCTKVNLSQAINMSRPTLDAFLKGDIHNANKYNEYIKRLLVYMQINESILDNYKTLPDVKKMRCHDVKKLFVKEQLFNADIPVITDLEYDKAYKKAQDLIGKGNSVFAISALVNGAIRIIAELTDKNQELIIGITDVCLKEEASVAVDSGARFIVSTSVSSDVGIFAKTRDVFLAMSVATVKEGFEAVEVGADALCLYPIDGISENMIRGIKRSFPESSIIAFGLNKDSVQSLKEEDFFAKIYLQ